MYYLALLSVYATAFRDMIFNEKKINDETIHTVLMELDTVLMLVEDHFSKLPEEVKK